MHVAALRAARGADAAPRRVLANLEKEVLRLERELRNGCFQPEGYKTRPEASHRVGRSVSR